ncbi:MAG: DMT family transporter [Gammaproteobacteria bacterium]
MLRFRHLAAVVGINAIFGGAYIAGKTGVDHFPPLFFAAMRFGIIALLLLPFLRWNALMTANIKSIAAFCLLMGAALYGTMYLALSLADGISVILICTQFSVPAAAMLGMWFLGERPQRRTWLGIWLAFAGVMAAGFDYALLGYWHATLLIIVSAIFYAAANVISRDLRGVAGVINLNGWMALVSAPVMLALSAALESGQWQTLQSADASAASALLYSALAVTLIGHTGMFALLRLYPVSAVMPYYVLTPLFGIVGGVIIFDESLSLRFVLCAVVALTGVYIVNRTAGKKKKGKKGA